MPDRFEPGDFARRPAISVAGRSVTYQELHALIDEVRLPSTGPIDLAELGVVDCLVTIFAAARHQTPVLLHAPQLPAAPDLPAEIAWPTFLVVMTSGTSGRPRTVTRTADSWSTSFRPLADLTGLTADDTVLLTGPLSSTLHLFAAVHTLWLGAHLTDDPSLATAVHAVPTVLADLLDAPPPRLRVAVVAGAAVSPDLEQRALVHGLRLVEYYGAAEMSFVAARVAPAPLRAFPGVQVRVEAGELWARSPYLALARTGAGADLRRSPDGFVTVGDLAHLTEDGAIVIRGRGDAAVSTGGHTVLVEDVEAVLGALPGVREVAVVGTAHRRLGQVVTAVVVLADGIELAQVRRAARGMVAGPALPRRWRSVTALPRTTGGKVARGAIADSFDSLPGRSVP